MEPGLPPELLTHVMRCLPDDRKTLARCTLVARTWRGSAQRLLFRRLPVRLRREDGEPCIQSALPIITSFLPTVKTLMAVLGEKDTPEAWRLMMERLLPLCPNVCFLQCNFWKADIEESEPLLRCFQYAIPALTELTLVGMWFATPDMCLATRARSLHLTSLTLDRCFLEGETEGFEACDWGGQDAADAWKAQIDEALPGLHTPSLKISNSAGYHVTTLLPWLAGPYLRSLDVSLHHDHAEMVKITTTEHAATLSELRLDLSLYHFEEAATEWSDHQPSQLCLSWWIPAENQLTKLVLMIFAIDELRGLVFDVQLTLLHTLRLQVMSSSCSEVKDLRDPLRDLVSAPGLRMVSLDNTADYDGWWDESILEKFASASERGILCVSVRADDPL